ncbi:MAG TPA: DUF1572 family protein [Terracidiphilus sp.]|jgi:hypothetical protein|nr:DUF1572 family protein [Terracidiphilus sp.]
MLTTEQQLAASFLGFSRNKLLDQYWPRLRSSVEPLSDQQIWWRPNAVSNSIGNLMLHLNGNVGQWLVASFNGFRDERNRPVEFNERRLISRRELLERLGATMDEAAAVLERLTPEHLTRIYQIQGYTVTGLAAVYQTVEHFGLHYGQIVYIVKTLTGADLGFYSELSATGRKAPNGAPAPAP